MLTVTSPPVLMLVYPDRHISPHLNARVCRPSYLPRLVLMLVYADHRISPVLMLVYADRHISPFEGSPRAGAAEYVHRGDV